jgi:hypothetical protein
MKMRLSLLVAAALLSLTTASLAAPIESYDARLSAKDHFNSNGERLDSVAAIIRQDRANYYVYGSHDAEDEPDDFFSDKNNRARLEYLLNNGKITYSAEQAILNGTPLIHVEIYRNFIAVTVD